MKKNRKITAGLAALTLIAGIAAISCAGMGRGEAAFGASYDVVVIGAGGAGLSAAIAAREAGAANVIVFEKMPFPGGNTIRATGGMNAVGTEQQARIGINDTAELFFNDTMRGGNHINNPALVRIMVEQSAPAVAWLTAMGADLNDVGRLGGASANRAHRPTGGAMVGPEVTATLVRRAGEMNIPIITEANVTGINTSGGRVSGVVVNHNNRNHTVRANAVVLATGGFGANNEMAASLVPALRGFATTKHPGSTGEAILMAERAGAALVDMEQIQTHPTYAPGREMITEAVRGNGAIMVNRGGQRIADEMGTRDVVSAAILAQEGGVAYLVFDYTIRRSLAVIEGYIARGFVFEGATPEALAAAFGSNGAVLAETITRYNAAVAAGNDAEFGRTSMPRSISVGPFYAIQITPAIHHTMGGVQIDEQTRVIAANGNPIPGFFAAGEAAGGVHGAERLGGNAMADIIVFGRIAGANAAAHR